MLPDSPRWAEQIAFRDLLRADAALARRYATLKHELAAEHAADRETYTAGKADFIRATLRRLGDGPPGPGTA